jgi:uncharacterized protein YceK
MNKFNLSHLFFISLSKASILALLIVISGCSTIYTQRFEEEENECSRCSDIPRVYSGTAYNLCHLKWPEGFLITIVDAPFSLIGDTVSLPYTISKQYSEGSICSDGKFNNERTGTIWDQKN